MTQPMFESENIYDLGLLQNAKAHGPEGTVKTIENLFYRGPKFASFIVEIPTRMFFQKYQLFSQNLENKQVLSGF